MSAILNDDAMRLLQYLHEHSGGSGERISLDPKPIVRDLRLSAEQFARDSALLAAEGYAGVRGFRPDANDIRSSKCSAIWVTRKGEEHLKNFKIASRRTVAEVESDASPK